MKFESISTDPTPSEFSNFNLGKSLAHMTRVFWLPHAPTWSTGSFQALKCINLCESTSFSSNSFWLSSPKTNLFSKYKFIDTALAALLSYKQPKDGLKWESIPNLFYSQCWDLVCNMNTCLNSIYIASCPPAASRGIQTMS